MKNKSVWIFCFVFLAGLFVYLYPTIGTIIAQKTSKTEINNYNAEVSSMSDTQSEELLKKAVEYNEQLANSIISDPFSSSLNNVSDQYNELLNMSNGIMAYVEVPSIHVYMPIYHGTDDELLKKGAGHVYGTSLPVGGIGTHAVIAGHTGLPGKKLFDDLEKVSEGDTFIIHVLGKDLTYTVDQILVIEPKDIRALQIDPSNDYVTLVTCTPYGVNTHRLLVRGVRTSSNSTPTAAVENQQPINNGLIHLVVSALFLLFIFFLLYRFQKKYTNK